MQRRFSIALLFLFGFLFAPPLSAQDIPLPEQDILSVPSESPVTSQVGQQALLPSENTVDENVFYDSESLVPSSEFVRKGGPRKANPRLEPGSKFVTVTKNHSAGSRPARLVAAERALDLGRYDSALHIYNELYARNKRDPNVLLGRASVLQHLGRTDEAIVAYQALLDLKPDNLEAQINMLGLMARRYPSVALERLTHLRTDNPGHIGILAQLAVVSAELSRYDDALGYLGMAAAAEPRNPSHLYNMAVIADRAGHASDAISYYEKSLDVDSTYGTGRGIPRESIYERLAQLR